MKKIKDITIGGRYLISDLPPGVIFENSPMQYLTRKGVGQDRFCLALEVCNQWEVQSGEEYISSGVQGRKQVRVAAKVE